MLALHKDLFDLLRAYSALVAPRHLEIPKHLPFADTHDFFVNYILLGNSNLPHLRGYPPSRTYQYNFWKWAIQCFEDASKTQDVDLDDRIYVNFTSLLTPSSDGVLISTYGPPAQSYVTHYWMVDSETTAVVSQGVVDLANFRTITLLESRTTTESGTTGLRTWLASKTLAQYLISHPDLVVGRRVLELGSGIGFLGIVVASLQVLHYAKSSGVHGHGKLWLTDVNNEVLYRCRTNLQLSCNVSSSHPHVEHRTLDWSDALNSPDSEPLQSFLYEDCSADLILGADLVFDPSLIPALVRTLCLALGSGAEALIALTVRNEETLAEFLHTAKQLLLVQELDIYIGQDMFIEPSEGQLDSEMDVKLFRMQKKHH